MRFQGRLPTLATFWLVPFWIAGVSPAAQLEPGREITVTGPILAADEISAVIVDDGLLAIASDEDVRVQLLDLMPDGSYQARRASIALLEDGEELDLEGLAREGDRIFAVGSHSLQRRKLRSKGSADKNRERLTRAVTHESRDRLFRFTLDRSTGDLAGPIESINLRGILQRDELLKPFSRIPGKENGVDIEALAAAAGKLFLGFRSPVLRSGHVPVMVLSFDRPERYELRFVDLDRLGIRGLTEVQGGFLILAGPERSSEGAFKLFFWDGSDRTPGKKAPKGVLKSLGRVPTPKGGKAEGIAVLEETANSYEVLIVYDDTRAGHPRTFRVAK